jgi:Tfp pilus assembly protein PilF
MALSRPADALVSFERALAVEPRNEDAYCHRGLALQALDRNDEALASYRQALAIRPDFAAARYNVGVLLCNMRQQLDEALESLDKVLALEPGNAKAWTGRAVALSAMQRFDEALASADRALAIHPGHTPAMSARGTILCESNRVTEAMSVFAQQADLTHALDEAEQTAMPHKLQHDREQRDHLAAKGITLPPGGVTPVTVRGWPGRRSIRRILNPQPGHG